MSNFEGTWKYAKNTAMGNQVVDPSGSITVEDDDMGYPAMVKFSNLNLSVDPKTIGNDIPFEKDTSHRGRLVLLSANTPAILVGSVARGNYSERNPLDPVGDADIDVFIAVKTS